ncbi:hypothetical protein AgCh_012771 [Apium graveolens]
MRIGSSLLASYAKWSYYTSKEIPKKNPKLDPPTSNIYKDLKEPHNKFMVISSKKIRSEEHLIEIKVSCIGMDEIVVAQRLREQKLKSKRNKNSEKARTQRYDVAEELQDEGTNDIS